LLLNQRSGGQLGRVRELRQYAAFASCIHCRLARLCGTLLAHPVQRGFNSVRHAPASEKLWLVIPASRTDCFDLWFLNPLPEFRLNLMSNPLPQLIDD